MARSNETFNKKEKEKKRLKKQQEKKEKAEVRKENSSKGKSLEDMMAYIDENGNITSTPPVAGRQNKISAEDIQIATPKYVPEPDDLIKTGVISFFNTAKGYGFIRDAKTQENIFFHVNNLNYQANEKDKVSYSVEKSPKGLSAVNVTKI
ncbi:cold shock domain-containing protein [Mucilaginibacter panaciglaebae]|uniref:Cold shock domain-containing protein n=1 Tax=Mucilaginibacter panaciglaebae TaxID=502331 RepID=A0ABP7WJR9_9SPHI